MLKDRNSIARNRQFYNLVKRAGVYEFLTWSNFSCEFSFSNFLGIECIRIRLNVESSPCDIIPPIGYFWIWFENRRRVCSKKNEFICPVGCSKFIPTLFAPDYYAILVSRAGLGIWWMWNFIKTSRRFLCFLRCFQFRNWANQWAFRMDQTQFGTIW